MRDEGELPEGWKPYKLDDLLESGGLFDGPFGSNLKTSDYTDGGVRVVRLENLANLRFIEEKRTFISPDKYRSLKKHTVRAGDLLFGSFLDDAVRVAILPDLPTPAIAKADCFCIRPRRELVDSRFLMYRLGATATKDALIEEIHGATRPRVTTRQLRELEIALPPVGEQGRIVQRTEKLFRSLTRVREGLVGATDLTGRLRERVLEAAYSGDLTARWRSSVAAVPGALPNSATKPDGWRAVPVGDLGRISTGTTPPKAEAGHYGGTIPFIKPTDLDAGYRVTTGREFLTKAGTARARLLSAPAVLVTCIGATIGKTGLLRVPAATNQQINAVEPDPAVCDPHWLYWAMSSPTMQGAIRSEASETTLPILNKSRFQALEILLPPIAEQREIVRRVEALFALADAIEKRVAAASARADKLTQSILAKAFRGELVPTEAELNRRRQANGAPAAASPATAPKAPRRPR